MLGDKMMDRARLDRAIEEIEAYTEMHPELHQAHHFLYDLPLDRAAGRPEIIVIGINPGETDADWRSHPGGREQETRNRDFHRDGGKPRSPGSLRWQRNVRYFAGDRPVVMANLFFWSSRSTAELVTRYGPMWDSPHLPFCIEKLKLLLQVYEPGVVLFPGLSLTDRVARHFSLQHVDTLTDASNGHRLVDEYREKKGRPWLFTKRWTGAFGFSKKQKAMVKGHIESVLGHG